jgi:hypothetical protein
MKKVLGYCSNEEEGGNTLHFIGIYAGRQYFHVALMPTGFTSSIYQYNKGTEACKNKSLALMMSGYENVANTGNSCTSICENN